MLRSWHAKFYLQVALCALLAVVPARASAPKLLLVLLDGFRHNYLDRDVPNLKKFYEEGVRAEWLESAFMSQSNINHYSIVTGLYPESNGITGNTMYDPASKQYFTGWCTVDNEDCRQWFGGEPIWTTNARRVNSFIDTRRSGVEFYIGSNVHISGFVPDYYYTLEESARNLLTMPLRERFNQMASWLTDTRNATKGTINLGIVYHVEPDHTGHYKGPESLELNDTLKSIDTDFGYFVQQLRDRGVYDDLNIIVVSDHGMAGLIANEAPIILTSCLPNTSRYIDVFNGPVVGLFPNASNEEEYKYILDEIIRNVTHGECARLSVYTDKTMPYHYHHSMQRRIAPIVLEAPRGVLVAKTANETFYSSTGEKLVGQHGWNNSWDDMKGIFLARGPAFKNGYKSAGFENIHIYELMCHILDVVPAPNNGSLEAVRHILKDNGTIVVAIFTTISILVGGTFIVAVFITTFAKKGSRTQGGSLHKAEEQKWQLLPTSSGAAAGHLEGSSDDERF